MSIVTISALIATHHSLQAFLARFVCRRCGRCCTEFRGVKLTRAEIRRMGVHPKDWPAKFKLIDGQYVLEQPCAFYNAEQRGCLVYDGRPNVCRDFPVHNMLCADGRRHLGVMTKCQAALEALAELEREVLGNR